jgi:short-subunit dehydrogenase
MVELSQVIESNKRISATFPSGLVAVFVGGTSGVGEYTLRCLSRYAPNSKFYIVGRSQESADRIIKECAEQSKGCSFEFIKADIGLLKNVDDVCRHIKAKENSINILFLSQGTLAFKTSGFILALIPL